MNYLIEQSEIQLSSHVTLELVVGRFRKVQVIGLGQVGLPVAEIQDRGFETYGFD